MTCMSLIEPGKKAPAFTLVDQDGDRGITKAGDFVGEKVGHDKINPIEDKLHDLIDKAAGKDDVPPAAPPAPPTPTAPPAAPPVV